MRHQAITWAGSALGAQVSECGELTGGMTSTMLALTDITGRQSVLRLMTNEPWRAHGAQLTRRERDAQLVLAATAVPAPTTLALDADGTDVGVAAHLMTRLPGSPTALVGDEELVAMADMLATIHAVQPPAPFRTFQSWAWEAKWVIPPWTRHPDSWRRAFALLAEEPPEHHPTFLHRDYSHRNLLWIDRTISGVVDWVETSSGPAWLDAAHAATNLALSFGPTPASTFLAAYAAVSASDPDPYWMVMDAVGFLAPPGRKAMFGSPVELARLDSWLHRLVTGADPDQPLDRVST